MATQEATTALANKELDANLSTLEQRANAIQVTNQAEYQAAAQFLVEIRSFKKRAGFFADPFIEAAKTALQSAKNGLSRWTDPAERAESIVKQKSEDFAKREREAAAAETRRVNEQRRKEAEEKAAADRKAAEEKAAADRKARDKEIAAAQKAGDIGKREAEKLKKETAAAAESQKQTAAWREAVALDTHQDVEVRAAIPKVAGIRRRVNQRFEVVDAAKIPRAHLTPNETSIGARVRELKDPDKAMAEIPGIRVWEEDSL